MNVNFPDTVQNGVLSFHQIKVHHIFLNIYNLETFRQIKFPSNFPAIWYGNIKTPIHTQKLISLRRA